MLIHPGKYLFQLPYIAVHNPSSETGIVPVFYCDVEMHVGNEIDLNNGYHATVIITARNNGVGITNHIERLATMVNSGYVKDVVSGNSNLIAERIRWIERTFIPEERNHLVNLRWDKSIKKYKDPDWTELPLSDWIFNQNDN